MAFSPDGRLVASAANDGTVRVWDGETGQEIVRPAPRHAGRAVSVAFSPDGRLLASGGWDRTVRVWERAETSRPGSCCTCCATPRAESRAWRSAPTAGAWRGAVPTRPSRSGSRRPGEVQTLRGHLSCVHGVAFSPDGRQIASASQDGTVKVWPAP